MLTNETSPVPVYRAFGLNIQCELQSAADFGLSETPPSTAADAVISYGAVPTSLENSSYSGTVVSAAPRAILLNLPGVARYLIRDGKEIIIEACENAVPGDVATYTFGTALGSLLYQRHILALHGSAVGTKNGAVIFTGEKGAGKSTTASALAQAGKLFLSDDICAVAPSAEGKPVLYPGLARSKIALDSYREILRRLPDAPAVSPVMQKYAAAFQSVREAQPLRAICVLEEHPEMSVQEIRGGERLAVIVDNIYRPLIHGLTGLPQDRFIQCAAVAAGLRAYRVRRPKDFANMPAFLELLEETVFRY